MSEVVKDVQKGLSEAARGKLNLKSILSIIALVILFAILYIGLKLSGVLGFSLTIEPPIYGQTMPGYYWVAGAQPNEKLDFTLVTKVAGSGTITWSDTADSSGRDSGKINGSGSQTLGKGWTDVTVKGETSGKTAKASFYVV